MKKLFLAIAFSLLFPSLGFGQSIVLHLPATDSVHSHTSAATLTLTAATGLSIYITGVDISNCAGATAVTAANPTYITTTNLTGSPQYQVGSGVTAGLCQPASYSYAAPLKSTTAGTNVTFVLPTFATNQTVSVNVHYFRAP